MTKHKCKSDWVREILEAARVEIDENGYTDFSMEAIVRRTGFSKGGIYRFFSNKTDVALTLFTESYEQHLNFDVAECLSWNLPIADTVFRLFARYQMPEAGARRLDRIWIRLLPEVLNDARFSNKRAELLAEIRGKFGSLCVALAKRDNFPVPGDFDQKLSDSFELSAGLLEGLSVQTALGSAIEHQGILVKAFINHLIEEIFK